MNTHSLRSIRTLAGLCIAASSLLLGLSASAQMLQQPLETGGSTPPPNLVFTLDDSGSMQWDCLPDSLCVVGGSLGAAAIPGLEQVHNVGSDNLAGVFMYDDIDDEPVYGANGNIAYDPANPDPTRPITVVTRQMRSVITNPLYYNPETTYRPWLKADGSRWPDSNPSAAKVRPDRSETQNLEGLQKVTTRWFRARISNAYANGSSQTVHIARYYNLKPGTDGTDKDDFILMKIQSGDTYPKAPSRTDCSTHPSHCTYEEEIQNFANWYTYFRNRALTAIAGTAEAFGSAPPEFRVGYGRINKASSTNIDGQNFNTLERGVRPFADLGGEDDPLKNYKTEFYDWLFDRAFPSGSTPLRRAMNTVGRYFERKDNRGPWAWNPGEDDGTDSADHSSCRRSIHLLMTDGMWNTGIASTSAARQNVDGNSGPSITGPDGQSYHYTPTPPFSDSQGDTLADVAMYYWYRDLRDDLNNDLKPIVAPGRENPAFWQHMSNFTIAFGVDGELNNPGDLPSLKDGTISWPTTGANGGGAATIDDLWHAALNSRGRALSANNATEYAAALQSIIDEIVDVHASSAGIGTSTTTLPSVGSESKIYTPSFDSDGWSGEIVAEKIDSDGKATGTAWTASSTLPAHGSRNIFTFDPDKATGSQGIAFQWSTLSEDMKTALWGTTVGGEGLVGYLRGNPSGEGTTYRARNTPLGDIVNSTPALVYDHVNDYYEYLPPESAGIDYGAETYRRHMVAKTLREAHLVVGANDGMVHAFRDDDGVESFAFMPRTVLDTVRQLADIDYSHRYFVDGPVAEADVYSKVDERWYNLVQASGGAGGKYIYTVRMPTPHWPLAQPGEPGALSAADSAPGASDVLWEINADNSDFAELGYVLTKPVTGVTRDGTWVTLFGNGYKSTSHKAQLFIVNALTGEFIKKIDTNVGSPASPNGLGGIGVVRDAQRRIVSVYAGDLLGNMWKFDLSSASSASWQIAFGGVPLFKARNTANQPEPISAAPSFRAFPTGGVMVLFGTGKLFESTDQTDNSERTLYGIWDAVEIGQNSANPAHALADSSSLVTQTINTTPLADSDDGNTYRSMSITPVDYANKRGWRIPMVIDDGERLIDQPQIWREFVLMQTAWPSYSENLCSASSIARRAYVLDPFMSSKQAPPFDGNADGTTESDIVDLDGSGRHLLLSKANHLTGLILGANDDEDARPEAESSPDSIRREWREIVTPPSGN